MCLADVAITGRITFTTGVTEVASVQGTEGLTISGGTLNLTDGVEGSSLSHLAFSGGTLGGTATLTIPTGGSFAWNGGTLAGDGSAATTSDTTVIAPGATEPWAPASPRSSPAAGPCPIRARSPTPPAC